MIGVFSVNGELPTAKGLTIAWSEWFQSCRDTMAFGRQRRIAVAVGLVSLKLLFYWF